MNQVICPLDSRPCEADCPDRYRDRPESGCLLATARELGARLCILDGGRVEIIFTPGEEPL